MAIITDVKKLRPELMEISDAEFERRAAEFELARQERKRIADVKAMEAVAAQASDHVEAIVAGVKFLHEHGLLPERLVTGFSRNDGTFAPGMILRAPTAESLVPRAPRSAPEGEKKRRRRRVGGELVPSKASQKGGAA